ncbi:hypothetical protein MOMA_08896 [Moraxella macacae 0408225]|uniref:Lipid/polyisoprenoid-binding YceI-like domain-containing protein n=1 Tax=Moraxella macacae 0408225 TaxID=1230338 RepID=L2F876_9GAMM|nr:YceI family protein [Moraxella macacae]ELA08663.1 hypothetical protein MOMA_08896 [Moraxella macacae 0408225]
MNKTLVILLSILMFGCTPTPETKDSQPAVQTETVEKVDNTNIPTDIVEWALKTADIVFTSTKTDVNGNNIPETGRFTDYSAVLDKQGNLNMKINLASVDTDIAIRDQRLVEWLFETDKFATAVISADLDPATINNLPLNSPLTLTQPIKLEMHGQQADLVGELTITRTGSHTIVVETQKPIEINIESFNMTEGLERLRDVMALAGINVTVPVTFKGEFSRPL